MNLFPSSVSVNCCRDWPWLARAVTRYRQLVPGFRYDVPTSFVHSSCYALEGVLVGLHAQLKGKELI